MDIITIYLLFYGLLAISHILIQMVLGHIEYRKQRTPEYLEYHKGHFPTVSVVIPVYNEDKTLLDKCLNSIKLQKYESRIEVFVIDDGSKNIKELNEIYEKYKKQDEFNIIINEKNVGKRESQKKAFDRAKGEIIVTIDSDTIIRQPNGIHNIIKRFKTKKVGAVTGDVRVINKGVNFLTRLINYRYWTAFHQERAAQSLFSAMMCCSGPFSAYRKSIVDKVKEKYVNQMFLGKKCTYGDDRHLTNLILEEGHLVVFDNRAVAFTNVPTNLRDYIKQQIRWNKSFYREMLWTLRHIAKHHMYLVYDMIMQFILPFLLIVGLFLMLYQTFFIDPSHIVKYVLILVAIALLRAVYGIYRTKDTGFVLFIVYGFMHVLVLIPVRLYSLSTMGVNKWGTR